MKKPTWQMICFPVMAALALLLVLTAKTGISSAYFTTYTETAGSGVIAVKPDVEIDEQVHNLQKVIHLMNKGNCACWGRVKLIYPAGLTCTVSGGGHWVASEDGYYVYDAVIPANGRTADALTVNIAVEDGEVIADTFNVIVIEESIPVQYDEQGREIYPPDWNLKIKEQNR